MTNGPKSAKNEPTEDTNELVAIVSQLEDLVKIALAAEKGDVTVSVDSFVDVHKKLMGIYQLIENFRAESAKAFALLGIKPEELQPTDDDLQLLGVKEKKLFEKLSSLQAVCEESKARLHTSLKENEVAMGQVKEELKDPSRKSSRRKGKFKGVGGKKDWLPS